MSTSTTGPTIPGPRRLTRGRDGAPAAPVRLLHLGVGNFFRAHQAVYTQEAPDGGDWGYAAFTGRSARVADELAGQDGLYTLLVKHPDRTEQRVVDRLSAVHAGVDVAALRRYLASPELSVVTSTITEAGYRRGSDGGLDHDDPQVAADIAALRADPLRAAPQTAPGKLVAGLLSRREADAGPLTVCPCDNVPDNGAMAARVVAEFAAAVDEGLASYADATCAFVTTMVDRITPRTTPQDRAALAAASGIDDPAAVVTEPYAEWVLSGDFPAGRPAWDAAGARFVDDVRPYETRKLWLLNGSHSLMAYAAPLLGWQTVDEAIADERVRGWVQEWWDDASAHLELPAQEIAAYRAALLDRYANPNIRHLLAQIAADGSQKVAIRHVPVLRAARARGDLPHGATRAVAAWVVHLRGRGAPVDDARADEVTALVTGPLREAVDRVLGYLGLDDAELAALVAEQASELESLA